MVITLLVLAMFIWFLVFLQQIGRYGFLLLLLWLLIAPVALNVIERPGANPFIIPERVATLRATSIPHAYFTDAPGTVELKDLVVPTRFILGTFVFFAFFYPLLKKRRLLTLDNTETWMAVFGIILIASVLLQSRRFAFGLKVALDAFIVPFMAYFVARRLITNGARFRQLAVVIAFTGLYLIVIAFVERLLKPGLVSIVQGPFETRDLLYVVVATAFFMALSDQLRNGGFFKKENLIDRVQQCVICLAPFVVLMTWRRGIWLGFISGLLAFFFLARRFTGSSQKLAIIGLTLLLVPVAFISTQTSLFKETVGARLERESTVYARFGAWELTLGEALKKPIFGIGLNNLRDVLAQSRTEFEGVKSETHHHNSFLAFLAELGVVGLFAYLMMVATIIARGLTLYRRAVHPHDRWWGISVVALMAAYLVPALTSSLLHIPAVSHVYVFVCIGAIAGVASRRPLKPKISKVSLQRARLAALRSGLKPVQSTGTFAL
jgi:O-antigen ligase